MNELPATCNLGLLGLDPAKVVSIKMIHERHENRLYRIEYGAQSFVLKWFKEPARTTEVKSYTLLEELGVPTLSVYGRTENVLLLEDLLTSSTWRPAGKDDMNKPETGIALAKWYLTLHSVGRKVVPDPAKTPDFLKREMDELDVKTITEASKKLGLVHRSVWNVAADHIEALKYAMRSLPETLNYNDFYWTNLALSRREKPALRAIVYDYHLLGIGLRYSDCRNVIGSLEGGARSAFWETYGPVDEIEKILDEPTSILFVLVVASSLPKFPDWAKGCLCKAEDGTLERSLRRALEFL